MSIDMEELEQNYLIIYPNIHISTEIAYRDLIKIGKNQAYETILSTFQKTSLKTLKKVGSLFYNSFESRVLEKYGTVREAYNYCLKNKYVCFLTGSGSCLVVLIDSKAEGRLLKEDLKIMGYPWTYLVKYKNRKK